MRKRFVAILGCGPAGLLAAHACASYGVDFVIASIKEKSILGGAQYSHIAIPGMTDEEPEAMLTYEVHGHAEEYRLKVYGRSPVPFVSMEHIEDDAQVPAWSLRSLYDKLWAKYQDEIIPWRLDSREAERFENSPVFDAVFSSVHLPLLCNASVDPSVNHWFRAQPIKVVNGALDPNLPDNTIRYDGTVEHSYYRMSRIFGVGSTEWSADAPVPPVEGVRTINKPIGTNCTCHPDIIRIGRFGTWEKGVLTFNAYNKVVDTLAEMGVIEVAARP